MLLAVLIKSWKQHPTQGQLYGHLPSIFKPSKSDEQDMRNTFSNGPLHLDKPVLDGQLERINNSSVRT